MKLDFKKMIFPVFAGFIFLASPVFAEEIKSFDAEIGINADSSINVSEKIVYDFGSEQKHGIYRDIPVRYKARGGNYNLRISDVSVTDGNGNNYQFSLSNEGDSKRIKIGNPEKTVSGEKDYVINYVIQRGLNYFSDHDELYWNVNGNDWNVSSGRVTAKVSFPKKVEKEKIQLGCFQGLRNSSQGCDESGIDVDVITGNNMAVFNSNNLQSGEGLTIVVGFPKDVVQEPNFWQSMLYFLKDNWIAGLPFLVFALMFWLWRTRGRDPKGRETIIPQYDVPDNLSPSQMGALIDEKADNKDVSADIVNLAVKGYLKINRLPAKIKFFGKDDYQLDKLKEADQDLDEIEKELLGDLFKLGDKDNSGSALKVVKLSNLTNKFHTDLADINGKIYKSLVDKGYFPKNPQTVRMIYAAFSVLLGAVLTFGAAALQLGAIGIASSIISAAIILVFGIFMPKKTKSGVLVKEHVMGLKMYLEVAEKDRIKFHNAPEKNPQIFEKFLPYAMILGVEKEWAKQFEDIYKTSPDWYSDPSGHAFSAAYFVSGMNDFSDSAKSTMASNPSSAASGGSGFSGGGSGGGFGGGGGGSW